MRHGSQIAPDGSPVNSHELARCTVCQSILYDVPVLYDGVPIGQVAMRCPHCHDGRPLEPSVALRQAHQPPEPTPDEIEAQEAHRARARRANAARREGDDAHRARAIAALKAYAASIGRTPTYQEMGALGPSHIPGLPSVVLLKRLFGTLRDFVVACGLTPRGSGRTIGEDTYTQREGAA